LTAPVQAEYARRAKADEPSGSPALAFFNADEPIVPPRAPSFAGFDEACVSAPWAGRGPASAREPALDPGGFILWTSKRVPNEKLEAKMGLLDKLLGRGKKAAGDLMGDASMRREGAAQEREGAAEDRAAQHEEMAQEQRNQAAEAHTERENT
jgi:uncharacterized protein YjbJ (UPF0337 family)